MSRSGDDTPSRQAVILRFPRKRGRPKTRRIGSDSGTPELIMKRLRGETAEALDLCLERGIITAEQHWCGIHLRWLYTLRHGAPGVRAVDPTHLGGAEIKTEDPLWRAAREGEYHEAVIRLIGSGHAVMLTNLCVYNERPRFLNRAVPPGESETQIARLREGLDVLASFWGRKKKK